MQTILEQLQVAFARTGWTMDELRVRSGLAIDRSNLRRKMRGEIAMRTWEAEVLAKTMLVTIAVIPEPDEAA